MLVPSDQSTSSICLGHLPHAFWQTPNMFAYFFHQALAFFWPLFHKAQLCGVFGLKWSYGQILQSPLWFSCSFRVIFGLFVASLINSLLAWSVGFGGRPSLGRFVVVPYSFNFLNNGCNGALWDCQSFGSFFITQPWSVLLHNFVPDLFGELLGLHGASCLVVLQTLGPFRTAVYILRSCDRSCHRLHTGRLYLTNYVTSEGNWLIPDHI